MIFLPQLKSGLSKAMPQLFIAKEKNPTYQIS